MPIIWIALLSATRWLADPILDKELKVASRRRRSYLLRFVYVGVLTIFLAGVWLAIFEDVPASPVYRLSRLASAGQMTTTALIWFQFIAAQIAAAVLLGDSIGSEVRKRTLPMLAVTPLSGVQIAAGKLAGGLLPIVMLLAASLPVLAVIRALGGVPWDYIVSAVCVTFSALVFGGALHLWASASQGSVLAVIAPALWYGVLARVGDALLALAATTQPIVGTIGKPILDVANPTNVLLARTNAILLARPGSGWSSWWLLNCLILLAATVIVLLLAARRIRILATRLPEDRTLGFGLRKSPVPPGTDAGRAGGSFRRQVQVTGPIRRVEGSPVFWKERRTFAVSQRRHLLGGHGASVVLAGLIILAVITIVWLGTGDISSMIAGGMLTCALGLHIGSAVGLAGIAAAMIPKEREARTLPVLLTTPLEEGRIVRDKALAAFRQSLPALVVLCAMLFTALLCVMALMNEFRWLLLVCGAGVYLVCLLGALPCLIGVGLYCGARCQTAAAARGSTFVVVLVGAAVFCFAAVWLAFTLLRTGTQAWLVGIAVVVGSALLGAGVGL
ncbi:MAG: hypothetical protein MUC88_22850, partial [Planctomycetes bacterium]|nr:hypothetical protein [Planctomycetota bacterium]